MQYTVECRSGGSEPWALPRVHTAVAGDVTVEGDRAVLACLLTDTC